MTLGYLHVFGWEIPALDNPKIKRSVFGHFSRLRYRAVSPMIPYARSHKYRSSTPQVSFRHFMAPSVRDGVQPTSRAPERRACSHSVQKVTQ